MTVSLCLIVKNEEHVLLSCLESVQEVVSQIVVVDTGSSDQTKKIAASFGALVSSLAWNDDFAAARNESLRLAEGTTWILWADADESVDETNRSKLRALLANLQDENAAYVMTQRSHYPAGQPATLVPQARLFRKHAEVRWQYRVHEQLLPSLRRAGYEIRPTDIMIDHTGYLDPVQRKRKVERNLRLLQLDLAEKPDDPFILFNLGLAYTDLGHEAEAVNLLRSSLQALQPGDGIASQVFAALVRAHDRLGQSAEAEAACRAGRLTFPNDPALLYLDGALALQHGDPARAEVCWLLANNENSVWQKEYFLNPDEGYRDKAREHLAELYLAHHRWQDLEKTIRRLDEDPNTVMAALVYRGRSLLARQDFAGARKNLEAAIAKAPQAVPPRVFLSRVLLQEGRDLRAAEQTLRDLLVLDPAQIDSWRNLALLLRDQNRLPEAVAACRSACLHGSPDPDMLLLYGVLLHGTGDLLNAESVLLKFLDQEENGNSARQTTEQHVTARHNLALIYRQLGRKKEAEAQWRQALTEMPSFTAAASGLAELTRIYEA
jgi:tetratricopeptide (TPR) repeat protein